MIKFEIPGKGKVCLEHAFFDLNGTLSIDGIVKRSTIDLMEKLSEKIKIHVITADTLGVAKKIFRNTDIDLIILKTDNGREEKQEIIREFGKERCVAFGNGYNDSLMLKEAKIGILILQEEGASSEALINSDIVVKNIDDAIRLLLNEKRLIATLRR